MDLAGAVYQVNNEWERKIFKRFGLGANVEVIYTKGFAPKLGFTRAQRKKLYAKGTHGALENFQKILCLDTHGV